MNYDEAKNYIYNNMFMQLYTSIADDNIKQGTTYIKEETSCDDQTAKLIWCDLKIDYGTAETNPIIRARESYKAEEATKKAIEDFQYRNNAECPYCHSKNTKKISGLSKAGSVAMFGVFAVGKVSKQWHCNQCKSEW